MKERSPSVWGINKYAQTLTRFQTAKDLWIEESKCAQNIIDFLYCFRLLLQTGKFCVLFVLKIILLNVFHLHQEPGLYELCQQPSLMSGFHLSSSNGDKWVMLGGGRRVGSGCLFPSPYPLPTYTHTLSVTHHWRDQLLPVISLALSVPGFPTPLCLTL